MTALFLLAILGQLPAEPAVPAVPEFGPAEIEFFEKKVRPILVEHCYECHSAKKQPPEGNLLLDRRDGVLQGGDTGPAAVAGDPDKSALVKGIRYNDADLQMPPTGKLPAAEIEILSEWVQRGLPFPKSDTAAITRRTIDISAGRKHWAFQPVHMQPIAATSGDETHNRIDEFALAALGQRGLSPSPAADKRVLIRRTKFDLLGLPPTPDEVEAFTATRRPTPTSGWSIDFWRRPTTASGGAGIGSIWPATATCPSRGARGSAGVALSRLGDRSASIATCPTTSSSASNWPPICCQERPQPTTAALGFLGLSPTYWKELKLDQTVIKQVVAEEWEERIDAVGGTFLGLTVACARCHDHKFDPLTQQDYYALAGVLASSKLATGRSSRPNLPCPPPKPERRSRRCRRAADKLAAMKEPTDEQKQQLESLASADQRAETNAALRHAAGYAVSRPACSCCPMASIAPSSSTTRTRPTTCRCRSAATRPNLGRSCRGGFSPCSRRSQRRISSRAAAGWNWRRRS